jgi:hypothetical protein
MLTTEARIVLDALQSERFIRDALVLVTQLTKKEVNLAIQEIADELIDPE